MRTTSDSTRKKTKENICRKPGTEWLLRSVIIRHGTLNMSYKEKFIVVATYKEI